MRFGLQSSNKKWVWVHKVQNNSEEELNMKLINWRSSVKQGWKLWLVRNMNISVWLFPLFCRAPSPLSFKWSEIRFKINFQYNPCYPFTCDWYALRTLFSETKSGSGISHKEFKCLINTVFRYFIRMISNTRALIWFFYLTAKLFFCRLKHNAIKKDLYYKMWLNNLNSRWLAWWVLDSATTRQWI